jgi:hypothetical protein
MGVRAAHRGADSGGSGGWGLDHTSVHRSKWRGPPKRFAQGMGMVVTASAVVSLVLKANDAYAASFGSKGQLALPPARRFAILTCMDARLDPAKYAGLSEGDAHVIRNAGGRASDDAIRSLVISYSCSAPGNGSSSTTATAAWSSSPTRSCAAC